MSKKSTATNDDPVTRFETSLADLEKLVERLEGGELSLEDSLQAFEKGVALTKDCQNALKTAELRISQLVGDAEGSLQPLDDENSPTE